ncbi:hypothetical protein AALO_G00018010 [Alosa alosa]|uniref:Uncharacterized protein n=1 Tax=Alosa alosa TaxID=278164 RepID=A0AAV6HH69_9TELE|nr:hypothetical protein AALO_G00018010 [Alosa alosa]
MYTHLLRLVCCRGQTVILPIDNWNNSYSQSIHGSVQDRAHRFHGQTLQHDHAAAAKQGAVDLKGGVLGGRPDQCDRPTLHVREESVLSREEEYP